MVKKRSGGIARFKSKLSKGSTEHAGHREGPAPPAHVQRKVARKVQFLDKVAASKAKALAATSAVKKKPRKKNKALPSLDTLKESLGDVLSNLEHSQKTKHQQQQHRRVVSAKGRMHAAAREAERLKVVLKTQHFTDNPILAITGHLNAVLPPPPTPPKVADQGRKGQKKAKRRKNLEAADTDNMMKD